MSACSHDWVDLTVYFTSGSTHVWKDLEFDQRCELCGANRTILRDVVHTSKKRGTHITVLPQGENLMSLLSKIKEAQLVARKARNSVATSLLTTLFSEAAMVGKNANRESTDAEVIAVLKKFAKNNAENRGYASDRRDSDWADVLSEEQEIIESFLPKQLSDGELFNIMQHTVEANGLVGPKSVGVLMKLLKEQYDGLYDGKQASTIAKQLLA